MIRITELIGAVLIVGGLVLLGLGRINFDQMMALVSAGIGVIAGKHFAELDRALTRRYGDIAILRKFQKQVTLVAVFQDAVRIEVLPEFYDPKLVEKMVKFAGTIFPGKRVEVVKGERIRAV